MDRTPNAWFGTEAKKPVAKAAAPAQPAATTPAPAANQTVAYDTNGQPIASNIVQGAVIPRTRTARVDIAPSLIIIQGYVGKGVNVSWMSNVKDGLYLGLDTGVGSLTEDGVNMTVIPLMFSLVWRAESLGRVHPYIGFSAGPVLALVSQSSYSSYYGEEETTSATGMLFAAFARPGLAIGLSESIDLVLEPRVGLYMNVPVFNPAVGISIGM